MSVSEESCNACPGCVPDVPCEFEGWEWKWRDVIGYVKRCDFHSDSVIPAKFNMISNLKQ